MNSYFKCGLCDHTQDSRDDVYGWEIDADHMTAHYRWKHSDDVGTKIYPDKNNPAYSAYDYRPIPDEIGPTFVDGDSGQSHEWSEIRKYLPIAQR